MTILKPDLSESIHLRKVVYPSQLYHGESEFMEKSQKQHTQLLNWNYGRCWYRRNLENVLSSWIHICECTVNT